MSCVVAAKGASMPHCLAYRLTYCLPAWHPECSSIFRLWILAFCTFIVMHADTWQGNKHTPPFTVVHCTNKIFQSREEPHTKIVEHSLGFSQTCRIAKCTHISPQLHTQVHIRAHAYTQTCIPPPRVKPFCPSKLSYLKPRSQLHRSDYVLLN